MYDRVPKPRIHLSSLRPFARRHFTCAHELGHHVFGHGTTIDQLKEDTLSSSQAPEEILANSFAANLLMPSPGVKLAFERRGIVPETASPAQIYAIACNFGVGFRTFVEHLSFSARLISGESAAKLRRWSPKTIRSTLVPDSTNAPLRIVDLLWTGRPIDAEVGDLLLCPANTISPGGVLASVSDTEGFHLFRCATVGIGRVRFSPAASDHFVRVQSKDYIGLSRFRHMEEETD